MLSKKIVDLTGLTEEELLERRVSDLYLKIEGTWLEECVDELYRELESKGLCFRPECYLADEWLAPDKEPVIGIPFFLADPVLMKIERKMMYEVEGGTRAWCMKLLRHEAGHAVNYAYRLYRQKRWRELFGYFSQEYGDTYRFRPYSKNYVRHLEKHYAQYHPDEDFAETFAVWLSPGADWREGYKPWRKALVKLEYIDELMGRIGSKMPVVAKGKKHWQLSTLHIKLGNYYRKKRDLSREELPDFHDRYLKIIFSEVEEGKKNKYPANVFIRKYRRQILDSVAGCTGERKYIIKDILKSMIKRSRECDLCASREEQALVIKMTAYVTALVMNYLHTGRLHGKKT